MCSIASLPFQLGSAALVNRSAESLWHDKSPMAWKEGTAKLTSVMALLSEDPDKGVVEF